MSKKHFSYKCGRTFDEVRRWLNIKDEDAEIITKTLYGEGYSERAICYTAALSEEKLLNYVGDSRFASILINEVRKRAYKNGDERWGNYKLKRS